MAVTVHGARPEPCNTPSHGHVLAPCDDEPAPTPGCIQAHGLLLALRPTDLVVSQVSDNCEPWLGCPADQAQGRPLSAFVGPDIAQRLHDLAQGGAIERNPCFITTATLAGAAADRGPLDITAHTADGVLLLEMEPGTRDAPGDGRGLDPFAAIRRTIGRLKTARSLDHFCEVLAVEARALTGLDRALVYQLHADGSGQVVADARREDLPSWLGLRYPADDIPRPTREVLRRIGVRPLPDIQGRLCAMVPRLNPDTGRPLEMTHCALRGASVRHTENLQNMGVAASLTMPILQDGALWGLLACHHQTATPMPYPMRSAAEFLAQVASLEIAHVQTREDLNYRIRLDSTHLAVLARATGDGRLSASGDPSPGLADGIDADGVAVFQRDQWQTAGRCPDEATLTLLAEWIRARIGNAANGSQVHATDALGDAWPAAAAWAGVASGVLAAAVSPHPGSVLLLWFRGEQVQTFNWAGNPHLRPQAAGPAGPRLAPRRSFEPWQEQMRGRSRPWRQVEIDAAERLRRMVMDLVLLHADRLAETNAELARSNAELDTFAYVVGHDLKEPLRGINKYAYRLLEDALAGRAQDSGRLEWLLRTSVRMDMLLDALLQYARVGRQSLDFDDIDLATVLVEATEMLGARLLDSGVTLRVPRRLPMVRCDRARVREILSNLISNAAKYTDKTPAWVEVGHIGVNDDASAEARPASTPPSAAQETLYYVRDNGIGIEARHQDRVFAIFKRLHAFDAYGGGSGAGLTIARKMVEQHHGVIWFDSQPGFGSTFYFTLSGLDSRKETAHGT